MGKLDGDIEQINIWGLIEKQNKNDIRKNVSNKMSELDKLFSQVGIYRRSDQYKELLDFIKKFPNIAPYNAMLIHIQKPGSRYVATAVEWQKTFNRTIKTGARPLVILRPFGPVAFVFELGDTEGKRPFPEELINPFKVEGTVSKFSYENLVKNLTHYGILCVEADYGTTMAGSIGAKQNNKTKSISYKGKEVEVKVLYEMIINKNHDNKIKFATILHELGHLFCGHLGTPYPKWWGDRRHLDKNQREFEAESVCWLICERMGLINTSAEYLSGYLNDNDEIPDISIDTVLKSVSIIEEMVRKSVDIRKEIIV